MEDSPAKVEALLGRYNNLSAQLGQQNSEGYRHEYAGLLMEESKGLLAWREYDDAERLATDAQRLGVQYNPVEPHPDTLLQQIAAERRSGGNGAPAEMNPAINATAINGAAMPGSMGGVAAARRTIRCMQPSWCARREPP